MKLKLGEGLQIPIEVAGQAVALVGIRGSGKTNTAGVIAEELLDRGQPGARGGVRAPRAARPAPIAQLDSKGDGQTHRYLGRLPQ